MNCPHCGSELPANARFCVECGADLTASDNNVKASDEPVQVSGSEYKCPGCGTTLRFDAVSGRLVCDACSSSFAAGASSTVKVPGLGERKYGTGGGATAKSKPKKQKSGRELGENESLSDEEIHQLAGKSVDFNWGDYKKNLLDESISGTAVYVCNSCGATLEMTAQTAATKCPYCGNNVIIPSTLGPGLRPNGIIPFRIQPGDLKKKLKEYTRHRPFMPGRYFDDSVIKDVQGVYVPFWYYDAGIQGEIAFTGTKTRHYTSGDYDITEVTEYLIKKSGSMQFENIPVDASKKADNALMDSIQPYNLRDMQSFDASYLTGFSADRFDETPDESIPRAETCMNNTATSVMMKGEDYGSVSILSNRMNLMNPDVKYCLLPVYFFDVSFKGHTYHYAVNGQTGKVTGEIPVDDKKRKIFKWGSFSAISAILFAISYIIFGL